MESSLRYNGNPKSLSGASLKLYAKQKLPVDPNLFVQLHGELDTRAGSPSYFAAIARYFEPKTGAKLGLGIQCFNQVRFRHGYTSRAKTAIPITEDRSLNLNIKGRCDIDSEFDQKKGRAAAELSWSMFNFTEDQDVRLKIGYEFIDKVPYLQIRENNWTVNADINGKWNVRFDL
ncbi:hypothetical protein ACHQM5_024208 [Ranunculus cassubicifolius]